MTSCIFNSQRKFYEMLLLFFDSSLVNHNKNYNPVIVSLNIINKKYDALAFVNDFLCVHIQK